MTVKAILDAKGRDVATVSTGETLFETIQILRARRIGAVVVTTSNGQVAGIFSERDLVRALADHGVAALDNPVSSYMTKDVQTCTESMKVHETMEIMTRGRFRHLPVVDGGRLGGIISIGDVVKRRIEDVEREAEEIRTYIATA